MTEDEKYHAMRNIHARARDMRGGFLNRVAVIEHRMANILTDYFCRDCPDKQKLFFEHIATSGSFGLRAKKRILYRIIKQDYPRYWEREQEHLKEFDQVADFRNRLAHCVIDVSDEVISRPLDEGIALSLIHI